LDRFLPEPYIGRAAQVYIFSYDMYGSFLTMFKIGSKIDFSRFSFRLKRKVVAHLGAKIIFYVKIIFGAKI